MQRLLKSGNGVETFFAVDVATGAEVLKAIDPAFVHPAARMRFQHETQVLRELSWLGLCTLYDAGQSDERLYLAQPFVPGETLEQVLRRGPLSVTATLRIGSDIATALDLAHGAGVCHRDVKPANIIVDGRHRSWPAHLPRARRTSSMARSPSRAGKALEARSLSS